MRPEAIQAWTNLYAAVALMAAICSACAIAKTIWDIKTGVIELHAPRLRDKALLLPRIWLHFQLAYFCGFPCIIAIAALYAHYIGFGAFNPS